MKLPNKLFTYKESTISKFPIILIELEKREYVSILQLYENVKKHFEYISDFIEVLECLHALGKIKYNYELRRIQYAI